MNKLNTTELNVLKLAAEVATTNETLSKELLNLVIKAVK